MAFDNYDCFVETLSGSDTLHDTVDIVYQDRSDLSNPIINEKSTISTVVFGNRRRWSFQAAAKEIPSYHKRNQKWQKIMTKLDNPKRERNPAKSRLRSPYGFPLDASPLFWSEELPHVDWLECKSSSKRSKPIALQRVGYLPPMNSSSTSTAVVLHTMNMAHDIADECEQQYVCMTNEFSKARIAFCIQSEKKPEFDAFFIKMG